jgi:hypothetical protein
MGTRIEVSGNCELGAGNSLTLQAVESLAVGDHALRLIESPDGGLIGAFATEPAAQEHLGFGAFNQGVAYSTDSVDLHVFQAIAGDTDGNRDVNGFDIQSILSANKFGKPVAADWTEGDFTGDGFVNGFDIQAILSANQFGKGPYASMGGSEAMVAVPEPSTFLMAIMGVVFLGGGAWLRCRFTHQG